MSEKVIFTYQVIKDDFVNAGKASSAIKKILSELGIDSKLIRKIAISSYEAEINIVIHTNGGELIFEIEEEQVSLTSIDHGPGIMDIEKAMTPGFSTASQKAREMGFGAGMGLPNMKKNSDGFKIESSQEGTRIQMTYRISSG